jgi:hypothetical protein
MSEILEPKMATYEAAAAISKGKAVKLDSTGKTVTQCSATTDQAIGVAQNAAVNAGDLVEVAHEGGGAKFLAKATIAAGDILGINADGSIQKVASANDRVIGYALQSAAAADLFAGMVTIGQAVGTQS